MGDAAAQGVPHLGTVISCCSQSFSDLLAPQWHKSMSIPTSSWSPAATCLHSTEHRRALLHFWEHFFLHWNLCGLSSDHLYVIHHPLSPCPAVAQLQAIHLTVKKLSLLHRGFQTRQIERIRSGIEMLHTGRDARSSGTRSQLIVSGRSVALPHSAAQPSLRQWDGFAQLLLSTSSVQGCAQGGRPQEQAASIIGHFLLKHTCTGDGVGKHMFRGHQWLHTLTGWPRIEVTMQNALSPLVPSWTARPRAAQSLPPHLSLMRQNQCMWCQISPPRAKAKQFYAALDNLHSRLSS